MSLAVAAATGLGCVRWVSALRAASQDVRREVGSLVQEMLAAEEEERRQLARELHDDVAQSLTAALSYLWLAEREASTPDDGVRARIADARRLASATLARIRILSQRLRPALLDDYGLAPSLEACARRIAGLHGAEVAFHADLADRPPPELETAVFRIGQGALEALVYVPTVRHLTVRLAMHGGEVLLEIAVEAAETSAPLPTERLAGVRQRTRALGGTLELDTTRGIRLLARVPWTRPVS